MSARQHEELQPSGRDRLVAYGFDEQHIEALYRLWDPGQYDRHDFLEPFLSGDASLLREFGWDPGVTYDVIEHGLHLIADDPDPTLFHGVGRAHVYLRFGFSPHQAHLVEHTPQAALNLYARGQRGFEEFLNATAPRAFLVNALLVAESRKEADDYLARYWTALDTDPTSDTYDDVATEVAMLAGLQATQNVLTYLCACGQGPA